MCYISGEYEMFPWILSPLISMWNLLTQFYLISKRQYLEKCFSRSFYSMVPMFRYVIAQVVAIVVYESQYV